MFRLPGLALFVMMAACAAVLGLSVPNAHAGSPNRHAKTPATVAGAKTSAPLQYAGTLEGIEQFGTQANANSKVQQALDSGLNTIRVRLRWKHTQLPPSGNTVAVCNLVHAAEEKGLKAVILSLEPDQTVWPLIQSDMDWFLANVGNYDQGIFDRGSNCIAHPSKLQIIWMIGNEPNVQTFCDGSDKGLNPPVGLLAQHQECANRMALLLHASYAFIQTEEKKYDVDLQVIGGGLSSNDAPFDLLARFFKARQSLGYPPGCDMNMFGFHPYSEKLENGPYYGLKLEPKLAATLKANKCGVPIIYTEMGFTTTPPSNGLHPCSAFDRAGTTEEQAAALLTNVVGMTRNQGVIGYINMQLNDEVCRSGGWSSGFYYWDGTPKPFLDQVRQIFLDALNPPQRGSSPPTR